MDLKKQLAIANDCLHLQGELQLGVAVQHQDENGRDWTKQLVGLSVATQLCRLALYGSLQAKEDRPLEEVRELALSHLASDDAQTFAAGIIKSADKAGAKHTLPIFRIIPIARGLVDEVLPLMPDRAGESPTLQRTVMSARFALSLLGISRAVVDRGNDPSLNPDDYMERVRDDLERGGPDRAAALIETVYGSTNEYHLHPKIIVSGAILAGEREIFGETRSQIRVKFSSPESGAGS
ncbi:MAG: hypothetical protein KBC95_02475 [Candidatus Peribacteraceae bacterium]|nr:hypothetical protein [Candidatus Peribacteraceae bacterium]